jgi:PAS domain S-box-containing protein
VDLQRASRFDRLLSDIRASVVARYGMAVTVVALALLMRLSLDPVWGVRFPLTTFYGAVVVAAWIGGLGAGLLATCLAAVVADFLWLAPVQAVGVRDWAEQIVLAMFVGIGVLMSGLSEALHRARARAEADRMETRRQMLERARAEEGVRFLAALVEGSEDAIVGMTVGGVITSWNPGAERMFGWTAAEVVGRPISTIIPPDRVPEETETMARLRRGIAIRAFETVRVTKDGRRIDVSLSVSPIRDARGAIVGASKIARDVTEHKRADQALREREAELSATAARLQRLKEANIIGVFEGEEDGRLADANDAFLEMIGFTRADLGAGAVHWRALTPPEYAPLDEAGIAEARERGACTPYEKEYVRKDGRRVPVLIGYARLAGSGREYIAFILDLTARKRLEEELRRRNDELAQADRRKDEFLAVLSHELRTPLTAMLGWVRLLKTGRLDPEQTRQGLETIERNTWVQARLIDDLLDVSRIIAGKLQLDLRAVDLVSVISDAVDSLRRNAAGKEVALDTRLDAVASSVFGDAVRLQQVVANLVSNAIKFTPPGGRVEVTLARERERARITVRDTGAGIEPAMLAHIFDRFRQADSSLSRRHGGLGLGLAIVRHLVELHGGTVGADSEGMGRGATFTVELPLLRSRPSGGEVIELDRFRDVGAASPRLDGVRVLAVDDHPDTREYLGMVLEDAGADVFTVSSGREALEVLGRTSIDVLVSDLGMPDGDGYELIRNLRLRERERQTEALPAVALTAYASGEDRARALEAGFDTHVPKPITPRDLLDVVARAARSRRLMNK